MGSCIQARKKASSDHHLPCHRPRLRKITYQVSRGSNFHMTADEVGTRGHLLEKVKGEEGSDTRRSLLN